MKSTTAVTATTLGQNTTPGRSSPRRVNSNSINVRVFATKLFCRHNYVSVELFGARSRLTLSWGEVSMEGDPMWQASEPARPYDGRTILFHWLTVLLVLGQWLGAHAIDWFPKGWPRTDVRSLHILFGALLALVIVARRGWRASGGRQLPHADAGLLQVAATLVHCLLYVLVVTTVILGLLNAWFRGDSLFGLFNLPEPGFVTKDLRERIENLHPLAANAILAVAGLHACAALWHQYWRRDGLLGRMIPVLARRSPGLR